MSAACIRAHPFVVYVKGQFNSRFSSLALGAQTAAARRGTLQDERTGRTWDRVECLRIASRVGRTTLEEIE